jgi:TolA-binding protein
MRLTDRPGFTRHPCAGLFSAVLPVVVMLLAGLMNGKNGNHRAAAPPREAAAPAKVEVRVAQLPNGDPPSPEAVAAWKQALESRLGPSNAEALGLLFEAARLSKKDRLAEAEAVYGQVVVSFPGTSESNLALWHLCRQRAGQGDLAGAFAPLDAVVAQYPGSQGAAMARLYRGNIFELDLRDYAQAIACYQEADRLFPGTLYQSLAWANLSGIYYKLGDEARARELSLRAVAAAPGEGFVRLVGERFWRRGDYEAAVYSLESYLASSAQPQQPGWVNYLLGLSYGNLGSLPTAAARLEQAAQVAANSEEASWSLYQLALAQKASKNTIAAKATLQSLISLYPGEFPAIRAKGLLAKW